MINPASNHLIPAWGAFEENLRAKGLSTPEILTGKDELRQFLANRDCQVDDRLQRLYSEVMPKNRKEKIGALKQEVMTFLKNAAKEAIEGSTQQAKLIHNNIDCYIDQTLKKFRRLGKAETTSLFFFSSSRCYKPETRKERAYAVLKETLDDYSAGVPTSVPMMARLLGERILGHDSVAHTFPFSDAAQSFTLLKRLAFLGDEEAKDGLCWCYSKDTIGSCDEETKLNLSQDERINGLRQLALSGHARSQYKLGSLCLRNDENLQMADKLKMKCIRELRSHETGHNYCLQAIVKENKIGDQPLGWTQERRLRLLHQRVKNGDKHALQTLFRIYLENRMNNHEPLNLDRQTQKEKLESLRPYNSSLWDTFIAESYRDNNGGHYELGLSGKERIEWLETQALTKDNKAAERIMAEAYAAGEISSLRLPPLPLKMPLAERISKLHFLADKGGRSAQFTLLDYYGRGQWSHTNKIIGDSGLALKGTIKDSELMPSLINWAFAGNESGAQNEIDRILNDRHKSNVLHLLFALNDAIKMMSDG